MSRVHFNTFGKKAGILGSERALLGRYAANSLISSLLLNDFDSRIEPQVLKFVPEDHYLREQYTSQMMKIYLSLGEGSLCVFGKDVDIWALQLNTLLSSGSEPLTFAARLHGQCEVHGYIEGKNRQWLSSVIRKGLAHGIYREDAGWHEVIDLLSETEEEPVVLSYSVCNDFPHQSEKEWRQAIGELRASRSALEIGPDPEMQFYCGHGLK